MIFPYGYTKKFFSLFGLDKKKIRLKSLGKIFRICIKSLGKFSTRFCLGEEKKSEQAICIFIFKNIGSNSKSLVLQFYSMSNENVDF